MAGPKGAICTTEMKKVPRFNFQKPDDIHIFGFTSDERARVKNFTERNPDLYLEWPLLEEGITKDECYRRIEAARIEIPVLYKLGYRNNNCLGCVKAQSPSYWNKVRRDFPEVFARRVEQSRKLGVRLCRMRGERIFLDEIPEPSVTSRDLFEVLEENVSCGPECGTVPS